MFYEKWSTFLWRNISRLSSRKCDLTDMTPGNESGQSRTLPYINLNININIFTDDYPFERDAQFLHSDRGHRLRCRCRRIECILSDMLLLVYGNKRCGEFPLLPLSSVRVIVEMGTIFITTLNCTDRMHYYYGVYFWDGSWMVVENTAGSTYMRGWIECSESMIVMQIHNNLELNRFTKNGGLTKMKIMNSRRRRNYGK